MVVLVLQCWCVVDVVVLFELLFNDLMFCVQQVYCEYFDVNVVQLLMLLLIKMGGCEEDCGYCLQLLYYDMGLKVEKLMDVDMVFEVVCVVKVNGVSCFCMGVVWCNLKECYMLVLIEMVCGVKEFGFEICMMFGMFEDEQVWQFVDVGFDYYNYNFDMLLEFYGQVILMCIYQDCFDMFDCVCDVGINVCCGGIIGMGELCCECVGLILQFVNLNLYLELVLINNFVVIEGMLFEGIVLFDLFEFVCIIVVVCIMMLKVVVCLLVGCEQFDDVMQVMCFFVGVNLMFYGDQLLMMSNLQMQCDCVLFECFGICVSQVDVLLDNV